MESFTRLGITWLDACLQQHLTEPHVTPSAALLPAIGKDSTAWHPGVGLP
jgi:hypothetical protein